MRDARAVAEAMILTALLAGAASGCAGNHRAPIPPKGSGAKTIGILVRSDLSVDLQRAEVSKKRGDKVHWSLEGGTGQLEIEPKGPKEEWSAGLEVRCAGAECWGRVKVTAREESTYEYRVVVDGRRGQDPFIIIHP